MLLQLLLVFFTAFLVVLYCTPALIKVAILKRLFDEPGGRKIHKRIIPTIGGIIIFAATLFSFSLWFSLDVADGTSAEVLKYIKEFKLIIATSLVLFFVGVKDDIIGTAPIKKLVAHVIVALILVLIGDVRITGLHGIFDITDIPYWASVFLSLFTYVVVVNGFNLIDGVDGLAAGVGLIAASAMGTWFIFANDYVLASLAFSLAGALLGFLVFNFSPAKIFMGDSGSLTIGLIICILTIKLIEYPPEKLHGLFLYLSKPVFAIAAIIYPLVDTLRIFIIRASKGHSPFSADRNHLHHRIIDCGFGHSGTVILIYLFSVGSIGVTLLSHSLMSRWFSNANLSLAVLIGYSLICAFILELVYRNKRKPKEKKKVKEEEISEDEEEKEYEET
ncbi:MAG: undecaprenyl/decaprenyl-phosphate alpha-N-acetylglucosaminyl 1-phosphate transferase, partial [Bacteroidia bacterium]|nr:undecaprenyl/decaprenyl-phosphate alpha-N-acetylglucosaminyl 1-phosphate transferase [Bacteroidia bacterium]